jgi:hypothetical protein
VDDRKVPIPCVSLLAHPFFSWLPQPVPVRLRLMPRGTSPLVRSIRWGEIDVEGLGSFRDAKLWPGGGRAWDWGETGTRHEPGIQPADVEELLSHGADIVVLSRGYELRLQTTADTLSRLDQAGVEVMREETSEAVAVYNRLVAEGRAVAALVHSTC